MLFMLELSSIKERRQGVYRSVDQGASYEVGGGTPHLIKNYFQNFDI